MKYFLVKFSADYADEFNVDGFRVMNENEYLLFKDDSINLKFPKEVYFGTNEFILFESVNEYNRAFSVSEITEEEYNVFKKFFSKNWSERIEFGFFLEIEDEDDDDEE